MLKVSRQPSGEPEIFRSIQGEGVSAGTPSVFLRLATCNLSCAWCDTKYTWDWKSFDYEGEVVAMPRDEVEERGVALGPTRLGITGGEPLLQQRERAPLVTSLARRGYFCEVETNGTIPPQSGMTSAISQWNVSPKTGNSGNRRDRREIPRALSAFQKLDNAYFKFVVAEPADIDEVCLLADSYGIPPQRVVLMPEGVTAGIILERGVWVADACARLGFRFSTRLHILLWGDRRGR